LVASFEYPVDSAGSKGTFTLGIVAGIKDYMYGVADNNGDTQSHKFLYLPVVNPTTGRTWLNNNLGAAYAKVGHNEFNPAQQAKSLYDYHAFGSVFNIGRQPDGHELVDWTSATTANATPWRRGAAGISPFWIVDHADFQYAPSHQQLFMSGWGIGLPQIYFWLSWTGELIVPEELWVGVDAQNQVCPDDYRLPVKDDWIAEYSSWTNRNAQGSFESVLKLSRGLIRIDLDGKFTNGEFVDGYYFSYPTSRRDESGLWIVFTEALMINKDDIRVEDSNMHHSLANGFPVRCIKD
jgi:hypothetical protein